MSMNYQSLINAATPQDIEAPKTGNELQDAFIKRAYLGHERRLRLFSTKKAIGQAILADFWELWTLGDIQYLGEYNPDSEEDFESYVLETYDDFADRQYLKKLSKIITRVFRDVYRQEISGRPYLDQFGKKVTVERLIETDGLVARLCTISFQYDHNVDSENPENNSKFKKTLLNAVLHERSRSDVEAVRDSALGSRKKRLFYREVINKEGGIDVIFTDLDSEGLGLLRKSVSGFAEQIHGGGE